MNATTAIHRSNRIVVTWFNQPLNRRSGQAFLLNQGDTLRSLLRGVEGFTLRERMGLGKTQLIYTEPALIEYSPHPFAAGMTLADTNKQLDVPLTHDVIVWVATCYFD